MLLCEPHVTATRKHIMSCSSFVWRNSDVETHCWEVLRLSPWWALERKIRATSCTSKALGSHAPKHALDSMLQHKYHTTSKPYQWVSSKLSMTPMLSSIANALSSRRRRFLRIAVWGVDEWAWGIKMNPMLLELPPQTAWHRLRLSSTESAPHNHRREVLETQVFKPMQPRHAEATGCSRWPWLSTLGFVHQ
jgi:hypothetical protein